MFQDSMNTWFWLLDQIGSRLIPEYNFLAFNGLSPLFYFLTLYLEICRLIYPLITYPLSCFQTTYLSSLDLLLGKCLMFHDGMNTSSQHDSGQRIHLTHIPLLYVIFNSPPFVD